MVTYTPPGWPAGVHPPGSDDFESTAVGWLLDVVPPDYRLHGVLRRYPVALATMARHHSRACVEGARQGYRTARSELAGALPPHAVDTVLAAYRKEGARLADVARAVGLVERALRGEVFTPRMDDPAPAGPEAAQPETAQPETAQPETAQPEVAQPEVVGPEVAQPEVVGPEVAKAASGAKANSAKATNGARASGARATSRTKASREPVAVRERKGG